MDRRVAYPSLVCFAVLLAASAGISVLAAPGSPAEAAVPASDSGGLARVAERPQTDGHRESTTETGSISGHVYEQDGITPIAGAHLHARVPDWGEWFLATTDVQGAYTIDGLSGGEYIVMVHEPPPGFAFEYYGDVYNRHDATRVPVTPGQTTTGIDFALAPGGTISGRVLAAADATPIENVEIHVVNWSGPGIYKWGHSGSDGSFTVANVPYADYRIDAMGYEQLGSGGYVREYWQEKATASEADMVTLSAGSPDLTGIDFTLERAGSITGHVFRAEGATVITDALIGVHAHGVSSGASSLGTYASQSDGSYTISGMAPGTYKVEANINHEPGYVTKYYDDKLSWTLADTVVVTAEQTTPGIDFLLEPAGAIAGRVYEQDGETPVAGACVNVSSSAPTWSQIAGFCCTDAGGSFSIANVPVGEAYVRTHADCTSGSGHPYLIDEWYAGGGSTPDGSLADPVSVVAWQTVTGVDFSLDWTYPIASTVIEPENGGEITATIDVTTSLSFPPDAVSQPVTVSIGITTSHPVSGSFRFLGRAFTVEAYAPDGSPVLAFSEPFTMVIHYDDADLGDIEEPSLMIRHWNPSTDSWDDVPSTVDIDANTVTAVLDHLTKFAVLGKAKDKIYLPLVLRNP